MAPSSLSQSFDHAAQTPEIFEKVPSRTVGRKATITKEELFQAALNLIGPEKSISSLSLREVAREAGIAPNSFYRHFRDIDELAIDLINRAGLVLRHIIRESRLQASFAVFWLSDFYISNIKNFIFYGIEIILWCGLIFIFLS